MVEQKSYNQGKDMLRLVGRMEEQKGLVPHPLVAAENLEGYVSNRGLPLGASVVLTLYLAPQPRAPSPGRGACITSSCENQ